MQNPFTTTFSKTPDTYITTEQPNEILDKMLVLIFLPDRDIFLWHFRFLRII